MIDIIKHLFGLCGESHLNLYSIIFLIIFFKLIYETNSSKTFWSSRK
jgi:hypothetical protein